MKRNVAAVCLIAVISLNLTGCGDSKAAKEARLSGIAQMNEGKYAEAILSFDTALEEADGIVNKFELDILRYRGEAEFSLGDYAAAVHTYEILTDVGGEMPENLYLKAAATALNGNPASAVADFQKASEMEKSMNRNVSGASIALSAIGKAYTDSNDFENAMKFFEDAAAAGKADAGIYNQMGLCMVEAKKYEEAIGYFEQGIGIGDENQIKELMLNKAAAYEYKGDFAGAKEQLMAYVASYGAAPELLREIKFLESR